MTENTIPNAYRRLRDLTAARVALEATGSSLTTNELLAFQFDWAKARDAVHFQVDFDALADALTTAGFDTLQVASAADSRATYLRRPDLGRRLSEAGAAALEPLRDTQPDIALIVADGLSGTAVAEHASELIATFAQRAEHAGWRLSPVILVEQGRVAIGDPIGEHLGARLSVVIIGERPGLSAADSLGVYITYAPRTGRYDAERNCISNIRPGGLTPDAATDTMAYLIRHALVQQLTGVGLKDQSTTLEADRNEADDAGLPAHRGPQTGETE
ncbi:ethanolamine ammonia-lyase subunit EutC [Aquisalimonas asiatica]|uniref:Ethanolamine ammonia-lyase small subunit n=1 Tax=Aquisalimonas asiatica TaxID=406100 RepID=A0A1H8PZG4_9GAMM|nr:ethanolamine ammonia-lyase subunit EutC [Aquisalimonas asiatica]SEO47057.1 Ethanolamine ammonia-lyase light chain [Aquisalimonas asiatica]